jgi:hypothetical protein
MSVVHLAWIVVRLLVQVVRDTQRHVILLRKVHALILKHYRILKEVIRRVQCLVSRKKVAVIFGLLFLC